MTQAMLYISRVFVMILRGVLWDFRSAMAISDRGKEKSNTHNAKLMKTETHLLVPMCLLKLKMKI